MAPERSSHIPDDTYEELIEATITALYRTGYADLGVRDIDAAFSKSRQLINHYFDGKDELITEVLEYLLHDDDSLAAGSMDADPLTKLTAELDSILLGTTTDDAEFWPIMTAVYEIQAQAHHNPEHQRLLNRISENYVTHLSEILEEGIEEGTFRDVDELRRYVVPVVLGGGTPYFTADVDRLECTLLETDTFDNGVVLERYAVGASTPLQERTG